MERAKDTQISNNTNLPTKPTEVQRSPAETTFGNLSMDKVQRMPVNGQRQVVQRMAQSSNRAASDVVQQLKKSPEMVARKADTTTEANSKPKYSAADNAPRLIYVNNPEQLGSSRLASAPAKKLIFELHGLQPGKYRVGYEHENLSNKPLDYVHGIKTSSDKTKVIMRGEGHTDDDGGDIHGGGSNEKTSPLGQRGNLALTQALNQSKQDANQKEAPRSDDPFISHRVIKESLSPKKGYFSGMGVFEVQGDAPFNYVVAAVPSGTHIAPDSQYVGPLRSNKADDTKNAEGNIDKSTNNRQNRVYNGVAKTSEVAATANFSITDAIKPGDTITKWQTNTIQDTPALYMPLRGAADKRTGQDEWVKKQHPYPAAAGQAAGAVPGNSKNDIGTTGLVGNVLGDAQAQKTLYGVGGLVDLEVGGLGPENYQKIGGGGNDLSIKASDGKPYPPNLGGYWTVYHLTGSVANQTNQERTLTILMSATSPNLRVSLRSGNGDWRTLTVQPGSPSKYLELKVPAHTEAMPFSVEHMVAGPSSANIDFTAHA